MAEGKLSTIKGMDCMGRVTMSMTGGMMCMALAKGALEGFALGGAVGVGVGLVTGMVSYAAGSSIGEKVYSIAKKVAQGAKKLALKAFDTLKSMKDKVMNRVYSMILS
ncbi:hypothetical protein [Enterocloster clostridioformis]|nr:hypothetical protein [Enterocloster clostridioformis]MDB2130035.1 hypothetical protein [Enterocloster clostridioformis]MDU1962462.1 hypothetical protein [Enterocloster clostridioformis]